MSRIVETFVNVNRNRVTNINATGYTISSEDDTINCLFTSGDVALNSNLFNIGKRLLIRKINETAGTININITNGTVTASALASLKLQETSNYWLIEKVSTTRWELLDGYESYTSGGAYVRKKADSSMLISYSSLGMSFINSARYSVDDLLFPESFKDTNIVKHFSISPTEIELLGYTKVGQYGIRILAVTGANNIAIYSPSATCTNVGPITVSVDFLGRWF